MKNSKTEPKNFVLRIQIRSDTDAIAGTGEFISIESLAQSQDKRKSVVVMAKETRSRNGNMSKFATTSTYKRRMGKTRFVPNISLSMANISKCLAVHDSWTMEAAHA